MKLQLIEKKLDIGTVRFAFISTIAVILFILLGHVYPDQIQGGLKKEIVSVKGTTFDLWSLSHFLFFGLLGYLFPYNLGELLLIGVIWEIVEDALASPDSTQMVSCKKEYGGIKRKFQDIWCNKTARRGDYWYGKWDDVFANSLGIIVGQWFRVNNYKFF